MPLRAQLCRRPQGESLGVWKTTACRGSCGCALGQCRCPSCGPGSEQIPSEAGDSRGQRLQTCCWATPGRAGPDGAGRSLLVPRPRWYLGLHLTGQRQKKKSVWCRCRTDTSSLSAVDASSPVSLRVTCTRTSSASTVRCRSHRTQVPPGCLLTALPSSHLSVRKRPRGLLRVHR